MAIKKIIPIHGTGSFCADPSHKPHGDHWYEQGHPWVNYMNSRGFILLDPDNPFEWSGDIDGHFGWLPWNWFGSKEHRDWKSGGNALRYYLQSVPLKDRNLFAHSHGMQLVMYAVGGRGIQKPIPISTLVTIGSPVRLDMRSQMEKARKAIGYWQHVYDPNDDRIQILGEIGDGHIEKTRCIGMANVNIGQPGIRHSRILHGNFYLWEHMGILDRIRSYEQPSI